MMSTGERVSAAPERSAQPGTGSHSRRYGPEGRGGHAVQDWPDGSKYEGEFVNGLKHGRGRYTWRNGEVNGGGGGEISAIKRQNATNMLS